MLKLQMLLRQFDPLLLPSLILGTVRHSDGSGTWPFFVDANPEWSKAQIVALLKQNGIQSWGWGATIKNNWHFTVNRSQASWAEYLMIRAGVSVRGRLLTAGNETGGSDSPTEHSQSRADAGATFDADIGMNSVERRDRRGHAHQSTSNPVELATSAVNSLVDRLSL